MRLALIAIFTILLLSTSALASHLFLESIRTDNQIFEGDQARVRIEVDSQGDEDIRMRVSIPELGIYRSVGPINIRGSNGESSDFSRTLLLPTEDLPSGEYWIRIYIKTDNRKIVKHRLLIID